MDARERSASESERRPTTRRRKKRNGRGSKRGLVWLRIVIVTILLILIGLAAAVAGTVFAVTRSLPSIDSFVLKPNALTTFFYDVKGRRIGALTTAENRVLVTQGQIPQIVKDATVAIEDKRFYQHHGVDFEGIFRAVWEDLKAGSLVQGAGTIEGQYVRNAYLSNEHSVTRKIREMWLAWQLDDRRSKDQILTDYLNTIFYGENAYGIGMASQVFFHKSVQRLTLEEAALLAGIANAPTQLDPIVNRAAAEQRRNEVLRDMRAQGFITQQQAAEAIAKPVKVFKKPPNFNKGPAQYFLDYATNELVAKVGSIKALYGGLRVYTSLNLDWQENALQSITGTLSLKTDPAASLVAIDPKTGYIRAMVGVTNSKSKKFNLAWQGTNQLGSAAKPFALVAAIEHGANPQTTYYPSRTVTFNIPGSIPWTVNGEGLGTPNLARAVALSDNSVFTQLNADLSSMYGEDTLIDTMHKMGFTSHLAPILSAVLGTNDVTTLETADAYATLASGGIHHAPQAITRIMGPNGKLLWKVPKAQLKGKRVLSQGVAWEATQCLKGVIQYGTGATYGNIGRPAAGKTGTTDQHWDAWFCGYTPQLATAVWMGYSDSNIPMYSVHGVAAWGGQWSTYIWAKFMKQVLTNVPGVDFPMPATLPLWSKWSGKYSGMSPSPSPSPSPTKTKKPSGKPTVSGSPTPSMSASPTTTPSTPPPSTPPPSTPPPSTPPPTPTVTPSV